MYSSSFIPPGSVVTNWQINNSVIFPMSIVHAPMHWQCPIRDDAISVTALMVSGGSTESQVWIAALGIRVKEAPVLHPKLPQRGLHSQVDTLSTVSHGDVWNEVQEGQAIDVVRQANGRGRCSLFGARPGQVADKKRSQEDSRDQYQKMQYNRHSSKTKNDT